MAANEFGGAERSERKLKRRTQALLIVAMLTPILAIPAPVSASVSVIVLTNSSWGPDAGGFEHIVGEVQNSGTENTEFVEIDFNFYNSTNTLLSTDFTFTDLNVLAPGERSGFTDIFTPPAGYDHYTIAGVQVSPAVDPVNHNFNTQVTNVFTDSGGFQHVVGTVTNNNTTTATFVDVVFTFRNCSGTVVDTDFTFVNTQNGDLGPSPASASFELIRSSDAPPFRTALLATQSYDAASPFALPAPTALFTAPDPPSSVTATAGGSSARVSWSAPVCTGGAPITGYTVTSNPGNYSVTTGPGTTSATLTGLPAGTYTFSVVATTSAGPSAPSSPSNSIVLASPVAVLPAMADAAYGGYTTVAEIQNAGSASAVASLAYAGSSGTSVGSGDAIASLPANATWTVRQDNGHGFSSGQAGSAVVFSNQPVAAFVNEFAPGAGDATSYTSISLPSGGGTTLFAPAIANNAYGGYTTGIGLVNISAAAADVTVTYRDGSGSIVKAQTTPGVGAGAYLGLYSGDTTLALPTGFAGTATITSSAGALAAVVNETGPGGQFSSYDAVPSGSTTLFAPAALRNAYGGYNTGMGIQNTTGTAGTVTINYYDATGTATTTTAPIAANGYVGVYQGTDIAADGPYTAKITSTVAIAAIVNEVAPSTTSAQQSTAYNTFASGSATLHLPLVESAGSDGWSTGEGIMNTGSTATTVTVTYYDTASGAAVGTPQSLSLQPNAFWGLYQPAGGLPNGVRAGAVVTTSGGQVGVICNESNATSFMSYSGS
jgi:Fibronectin type III domain